MILNVLIRIILAQELSTDGSKSSSVIISIYVFILKVHLRIWSCLPVKFVNFLKSRLNFNILLSLNICKQTFHISHVRISQKLKGVLM